MSSRSIIIQGFIILSGLIFIGRLFSIQVVDDTYKLAAQNNIVQKIVDYPYRGLIYDRDGNLLVSNTPVYDLMIVPKEVNLEDSSAICTILKITNEELMAKYKKAKSYSPILSSKFLEQIPNTEFAAIQDQLVKFEGFYPLPRTIRSYRDQSLANTLGYIGEISKSQLAKDTTHYYKSGDYIGISGVERSYEPILRGKRGVNYKIVDVQGVIKGSFQNGKYDTLAEPGQSITLTINLELQKYAEKLMAGKVGSMVAIDPSTGEILAMVSSPTYDPNLLSGRDLGYNFNLIQKDSLNPLFNRPLQAMYPPGSMFKTMQALIALQSKTVGKYEQIYSDWSPMGDLAPKGYYDIEKSITFSSNTYYYKVFRRMILRNEGDNPYLDTRIGLDSWNEAVAKFSLGKTLGVDLPGERSGYVPTVPYYDRVYGTNRWKFSNIYSLSIGQGELLVTPIQMANLGAIIANQGYYYTPHIVKAINGEPVSFSGKNRVGIDSAYFQVVVDGMEEVIKVGSGVRAYIPDLPICGKTSTVENPHGLDHSGFMGFAPKDDPKIAIAVYVENAGWGGRAAGSTASLIIEKFIKGEITRPWVEEYILKGDFADQRPSAQIREVITLPELKPATINLIDEGQPTDIQN